MDNGKINFQLENLKNECFFEIYYIHKSQRVIIDLSICSLTYLLVFIRIIIDRSSIEGGKKDETFSHGFVMWIDDAIWMFW